MRRSHKGLQTEGRCQLEAYLAKPANSQTSLAKALSVNQSTVHIWAEGKSLPDAPHRILLEEVAGIPGGSWLTAKERRLLDRAREKRAQATGTEN